MESNFFHRLDNLPLLPAFMLDKAKQSKYEGPNSDHYRIMSTANLFTKGKFCQLISKQFGTTIAKYVKMEPMTGYEWHTDGHRQVGLNFLLTEDNDYITIYKEHIDRLTYNLYNCVYEPRRPTLLNTSHTHCVINYSKNVRYTLTLEFPINATYNDVKDFLSTLEIKSYF